MTQPTRYTRYPASADPELVLYAQFAPAPEGGRMLLRMHGWHGSAKAGHSDDVSGGLAGAHHHINPDLRGRGDSSGKPDANGWELLDAVDALAGFAAAFPEVVDDRAPLLWGGSGGGGNVLGLLGKFPDLFAAAVCECGISDYGLWFAHDAVGEFRDELEDAGWIGGTPASNPEAYLSRGGRTTAQNLLTPLLLVHGEDDARVPYEQAAAYLAAVAAHGRRDRVTLLALPGVGNPGHYSGVTPEQEQTRRQRISSHLQGAAATAPVLPAAGVMVVAGFLRTREFSVTLESIDQVGLLYFDLASDAFVICAPSCRHAILQRHGVDRHLACRAITFDALCRELRVPDPATL